MDQIENYQEHWKNRLRNHSLWTSLVLYLLAALAAVLIVIGFTRQVCISWQHVIRQVNGLQEDYTDWSYLGGGEFVINDGGYGQRKRLTGSDGKLYEALEIAKTACIPFYSAGAVLLASFFYYRNKLKNPIYLLRQELEAIRGNDLSFSCRYESADEMGELCGVMDQMRLSMRKNQEDMWELIEAQRTINAAFAHDLRTPLTVIAGSVEMLSEYAKKGRLTDAQAADMLASIQRQTKRIQAFAGTMKRLQDFELLELQKSCHSRAELAAEMKTLAESVAGNGSLVIETELRGERQELYYDENAVMEVLGNLLSNAVRYARERIELRAECGEDFLSIYVKDDGRGFSGEELYRAANPYYSDKSGDEHFGLGLTICKLLCKKHGGSLSLANSLEGGAIVCGKFFVGK